MLGGRDVTLEEGRLARDGRGIGQQGIQARLDETLTALCLLPSGSFNMDAWKKFMPNQPLFTMPAGGKQGAGRDKGDKGEEAEYDEADMEEGWLKIEQEFQKSLMRAAFSAEKRRGTAGVTVLSPRFSHRQCTLMIVIVSLTALTFSPISV
jgi:hypothetical protein